MISRDFSRLKRLIGPKFFLSAFLFGVGILLGALLVAYSAASTLYEYRDTFSKKTLIPVDAIVVLSGARGRYPEATSIWFQYFKSPLKNPVLFVSGMGPHANWNTFIQQIPEEIAGKLPPSQVVLEKTSSNTAENAHYFLRHANGERWRRILLMTSTYHMKRAHQIFKTTLNRSPSPIKIETLSIDHNEEFQQETWRRTRYGIQVTLIEFFKWIYYQTFWEPQI